MSFILFSRTCSNFELRFIHAHTHLRKFELLDTVEVQDGWTVDIRKRLGGKTMGQLYKVFMDKQGRQYMTEIHGSYMSYLLLKVIKL